MSILIKGMNLPYYCGECIFCHDLTGYGDCECPFRIDTNAVKRPENCPLVELSHHGRLVDVEWLKLTIAITLEYLTRHPLMSDKEIMLKYAFKTIELMVDDAPTIIEAEEEME